MLLLVEVSLIRFGTRNTSRSTVKRLRIGTGTSGIRKFSTTLSSSIIHGLHGSLNGFDVFASAATESQYNIISAQFAKHCGLSIGGKSQELDLARGRKTKCIGTATADWKFRGEAIHKKLLNFLVLPECTRDVVLGYNFLEETRTLSTNWHRLETLETQEGIDPIPCAPILGAVKHRVVGTLEKRPLHAVPGTGSEVNILSEDYLRECGLTWLLERDCRRVLKFIDGTKVGTLGQVRAAWRFGRDRWPWQTHIVRFDVLPGCHHSAVLGQKLLFESFAYIGHADCFVEDSLDAPKCWQKPMKSGVGLVPFFMRAPAAPKGIAAATKTATKISMMQELARRANVEREFDRMPSAERLVAEIAEQARRQNFVLGEQTPRSTYKHMCGSISDEDDDSHGLKRKSFLAAFAALNISRGGSHESDRSDDDDDHWVPRDH